MGKLFINLGKWMQRKWCSFQRNWNSVLTKAMFKVSKCDFCSCKDNVS